MDTSAAKAEMKKVLKIFRAAEQVDEVLATAIAAEQIQSTLEKDCKELEAEKADLQKQITSLAKKFKDAAHKVKDDTKKFEKDHQVQMSKHQELETGALQAVENARDVYKGEVKKLEADFKALKEKRDATIQDLDNRVDKAKLLLNDTMEKFRAIA